MGGTGAPVMPGRSGRVKLRRALDMSSSARLATLRPRWQIKSLAYGGHRCHWGCHWPSSAPARRQLARDAVEAPPSRDDGAPQGLLAPLRGLDCRVEVVQVEPDLVGEPDGWEPPTRHQAIDCEAAPEPEVDRGLGGREKAPGCVPSIEDAVSYSEAIVARLAGHGAMGGDGERASMPRWRASIARSTAGASSSASQHTGVTGSGC